MNLSIQENRCEEDLIAAYGRQLPTGGKSQVTVGIQGLLIPYKFYVIHGLNQNVLIGLDYLQLLGVN